MEHMNMVKQNLNGTYEYGQQTLNGTYEYGQVDIKWNI